MSFPIQRALLSVSDKTGLIEFASRLAARGVVLYSTGGTRAELKGAGLEVIDVADYTGYPEMMDGRVKTLHPRVHGGLLGRRDNPDDMVAAHRHGIVPFELAVVNLYPFEQTIARGGVTVAEAIEQIDIGGPTLIRSASKNHAFVTIASSPAQYRRILAEFEATGATSPELRRQLAGEAFAHTARYDAAIARYFAGLADAEPDASLPVRIDVTLERRATLRYGENPHQSAALYATVGTSGAAAGGSLVDAEKLHGKELSYNNLLDLDAAWACAKSLPTPGVAVLKHNNPCGAATAATIGEATRLAWDGDPVSAFGSILGFNATVDANAARCLAEPGKFVEAIVAPGYTDEALHILTTEPKWKSNVRLLRVAPAAASGAPVLRAIDGGYLAQSADDGPHSPDEWRCVTSCQPTDAQLGDLRFAWAACRHVKSNAIVLARGGQLVGVGAGQMSRVDSVEIAIKKAGDRSQRAVLASDAFFPFEDSILTAHAAGVAAIIQPGGSKRDDEVVAAAERLGIAMLLTGRRHFRH
ncbi:MAG: bifunctional phosphoribosylaminoimidazolecarboxamide formyltransferase/IMP cyclohydrolase [Lacipirellulaceae bacterium]